MSHSRIVKSANPPQSGNQWHFRFNIHLHRRPSGGPAAVRVARMFSLPERWSDRICEDFELKIATGQIAAVVGPSGAGKSVLLRHIEREAPDAIRLDVTGLSQCAKPAVDCLCGGSVGQKLQLLCRCGLGEAKALVTPARLLSAGQSYRLALADALHKARQRRQASLILADNFADCLDETTGRILATGIRKLITSSAAALIAATPRPGIIEHLKPDAVYLKPPDGPVLRARNRGKSPAAALRWRITRGTIRDYAALGRFHYLGGPPATHKRVYVIRTPKQLTRNSAPLPETAAILTVSPPLANVRGRNVATAGRYLRGGRSCGLRRLNAEMECISRIIVHPIFRGCGLAGRLVEHAVKTARTPLIETLAVMGAIHPLFEKAGMTCYGTFAGKTQRYRYYLAQCSPASR